MTRRRPRLAVWKFTSCDGCQLSLLDCEDELLTLDRHIDIAYFMEATSRAEPGPYDLSLVEGSISTPEQLEQIVRIRDQSRVVVAIGACATSGGLQALRNFADIDEMTRVVYASPAHIQTLSCSTPISQHIAVDFELQGCPISKTQLLEVLGAFLRGERPVLPTYSVCVECKLQGVLCLSVSQGRTCLGPITQAGCGALCPRYDRGCFGCYGPKELSQPRALGEFVKAQQKVSDRDWVRWLRSYQAGASEFAKESERHEKDR